jgi:hypothetical protein
VEQWEWEIGYFIIAGFVLLVILLMIPFVKASPDEFLIQGLEKDEKLRESIQSIRSFMSKASIQDIRKTILEKHGLRSTIHHRGVGFFEAWLIPGVIKFAIVYLCVKGTVYGCMFWLPSYLISVIGFGDVSNFFL